MHSFYGDVVEDKRHRIPFTYFLREWKYGVDSIQELIDTAEKITPMEYRREMKGRIFCPECYTPLSRTPTDKDIFTNSRSAHFKHQKTFGVKCALRVARPAGLNYESEEEVRQAVQNENLVIVGGWLENAPENTGDDQNLDAKFNQTKIFDKDGPDTEIPLGRHTGKKFPLPSKISSVLAICRNFDENLKRAFFFPDSQYVMYLSDKLFDANRLQDELPISSNLYFGKITKYSRLSYRNIIYVESENFPELKLYTWPHNDERKFISQLAIGRIILFYVHLIYENEPVTIQSRMNSWGQYSLLPEKYEAFLPGNK